MTSQLYFQLEQEAHVIRSSIAVGLTHLRQANLHEKGAFYTAFFQLAIGFERMAKLGIVLDHLAHHNLNPPGPNMMKDLGHDLVALRQKVEKISMLRAYQIDTSFSLSVLGQRILDFLSRFARGMRYANLDGLSSGRALPTPFSEWEPILRDIITSKVRSKSIEKFTRASSAMQDILGDLTVITGTGLTGIPLNFQSAYSTPEIYNLAAPHVIWEMLLLLAPLRDVVVAAAHVAAGLPKLSGQDQEIPYMPEFFGFICLERSWQMRRKRWPG
jgi:hypothetical protein